MDFLFYVILVALFRARVSVAPVYAKITSFFDRAPSRVPPLIRQFGEHLCPRKTAPPLGCRLVGGGDLTGSGGRNAANVSLCFAFPLRLARTTHRNGGSANTSAHAKRHPLWGAVWWAEVETSQVREVATPQTFYSILPSRCGLLVRTTETAVR